MKELWRGNKGIVDVGCRMSDVGYRMSDVGCMISDIILLHTPYSLLHTLIFYFLFTINP
ncbi:MAG: hypothetical protein WC780_15965 [Lentimicrobiaceae bacterium]